MTPNVAAHRNGDRPDRRVLVVEDDEDILDSMSSILEDAGRGMSRAQQDRIFEPFFTTRAQLGGTGLGLAICKEIIESHSGTIEVMSELARGSTFRVRLPSPS